MSHALRITARPPAHHAVRCQVCGCTEVHVDEVIEKGVLQLAECPRCDHLWTCPAPPARTRPTHRVLRLAPEVASAA